MTISILGCGWLGLPFAEHLRADGYVIKASTTSPENLELLKGKDINPFLLKLKPQLECESCEEFWNSEALVLNIPLGRGRVNVREYHLHQINAVIKEVKNSPIDCLIFISSTSVYPEKPGIVSEEDAEFNNAVRPSGNALLDAEKKLMDQNQFDTTVIRFGGLYGYDRHPAKYLSGRKNIGKGNAPVNLMHRDDCIAIIQQIIEEDVRNEIFNGVSDGHPPKKMYYPAVADSLDLEPPTFKKDEGKNYKVVSNRKLKELLNYNFKYPNPMDLIG
jgi:nucleoside-diphosphate-sugar epimerase